MIFPANLLTAAKHPAFSTNHLTDTNTQGMSVRESDVKIGCLETGSAVSVRQRYGHLTLRCRQRKRNGGYVQTTKTRTDKHCTFN